MKNLMGDSEKRASALILSTPFHRVEYKTVRTHRGAFCLSVDAERCVALVTLAGEVSCQLTIADHQKQATTYETIMYKF